ncbi:natural resistance-associated macrophage protein [Saccharata proteae CBS 121410]|uniref:Natural resistance-associated macrophage protein n=1 Tax=Saccharata proteae CBS 121410 TaxID=1314787 RepID=A0A6A5YFR2_9PEZI|nr:natural resistance-associated macrophage protein [Saccharata proteae CBS 121410]
MNCPSRVDPILPDGWNQNPNDLNADTTTRNDLNHMANSRLQRRSRIQPADSEDIEHAQDAPTIEMDHMKRRSNSAKDSALGYTKEDMSVDGRPNFVVLALLKIWRVFVKYLSFVGPGFMVAVAYIDPGNYSTDVAAGATYRFKLLFIVLMSNIFAIVLQSLCVKLGCITGMDLANNCREHLPRWMNITLWVFAESAIIATDIAEVIGTAIALNVLINVPLVAGCAISIVDVLIILIFYRPEGGMRIVRAFEYFVMLLVLGVVVCFCFQLSLIEGTTAGEVFKGYLPSSAIVQSDGLYQACGILGATVMPHSLYLGSGMVQPRLRDFDFTQAQKSPSHGSSTLTTSDNETSPASDAASVLSAATTATVEEEKYRPSLGAIKNCMAYSIAETAISLFTFALFINSSILIVAGASLYGHPGADDADLFGIHDLLSRTLAPIAGTIFALALLLSGISAGIVCTIAGQMVSEGQIRWTCKPWIRRLFTRSISIVPSIIIAGAVGKNGLSAALNGSQVALSVILPFVSAPLVYFTCRNKYMTVSVNGSGIGPRASRTEAEMGQGAQAEVVKMRNHWITTGFAVAIWGVIVVMNVALLVLVGMGKA